jgi:hypothetical protein
MNYKLIAKKNQKKIKIIRKQEPCLPPSRAALAVSFAQRDASPRQQPYLNHFS